MGIRQKISRLNNALGFEETENERLENILTASYSDVLTPADTLTSLAPQNKIVSKSYSALLLNPRKRCCRQLSHNVTLTTPPADRSCQLQYDGVAISRDRKHAKHPINGFSTPSTDNSKACVINATHNRDAYVTKSATSRYL
ncbi:respiratory burst oxidaseprotein B-like [Dorcoceras hygrometricum]|uniref:Respiratory burst oxidaseprotein B-like n=1 Tax=Dorcoceras hygrometricum TaxID=472368 RepID=A0A2Z7BLR8_9LAMI|nr:respiratory burst oxidaseprotein B-like [Dorcoceras hygrometricum]